MKKIFSVFLAVLLACLMVSPTLAASDLNVFISNLNVQAQADLGAFKVRLSTQFGVPAPRVEAVMASVGTPGDAYMCFRVGQVASQPVETVMKEYQGNRELGLLPTFHCPARLDKHTEAIVKEVALKTHHAVGCLDISSIKIQGGQI